MEVASAAPITAAADTESLETRGVRRWGGAGGGGCAGDGGGNPRRVLAAVPGGYADPAAPEESCWPPAIPPALHLEWATTTWAEWLMPAGGGGCREKHLVHIRGSLPFPLEERKKKTCHGVFPARQHWETFQNAGFALQPVTNVPRNASRIFIPGPGSRGEQGGREASLHFQVNFVRSQGLFPSGVGTNHSHRSSCPRKGKPAGGSCCVPPVQKGPRARTAPGCTTFLRADGAAAGSQRDSPGPRVWGLESPVPGGARRRSSPDGSRGPGAGASLPPAWDRCLLPAPGNLKKEPR